MRIEKISFKKCKTMLESDGSVYTDEEISQNEFGLTYLSFSASFSKYWVHAPEQSL